MAASRRGRRRNRRRLAGSGTSRLRRFSASRSKPPARTGLYSPSKITVSPRSRRRRAPGCSRAPAWYADRARRLPPDPAMSRCRTAPQGLARSRTGKRRDLKRGRALPRRREPPSRGRARSTGKRRRSKSSQESSRGLRKNRRKPKSVGQSPNRQGLSRQEPSHRGPNHQDLNQEWKSHSGSRRRGLKSRVRPLRKRVRRSSHDRPPHRLRDRRSPRGRLNKSGSNGEARCGPASLLPLWKKVAAEGCRMRGRNITRVRDPSSVSNALCAFDPPSPTTGKGKAFRRRNLSSAYCRPSCVAFSTRSNRSSDRIASAS